MPKKKICLLMSALCITPFSALHAAPDAAQSPSTALEEASRPGLDAALSFDEGGLSLQWARQLGNTAEADDYRRSVLRAEFRMLSFIGEQLEQHHSENALPVGTESESTPPPEVAATPAAPATPAATPVKPVEPDVVPRANQLDEETRTLLLAGSAGLAALLALLFMWRRPAEVRSRVDEPFSEALTVLNLCEPTLRPARPAPSANESFLPSLPLIECTTIESAGETGTTAAALPDDQAVIELARILTAFGRDTGAAQALLDHLEQNPSGALQPWIRLLEIYRGNDMRQAFELLADHLNRAFNVELIRWDDAVNGPALELTPADLEKKRAMTLELYPHIRDQIDALWGREECVAYLQKLLRDNREGARNGFTFQVVQEILFLTELMLEQKAVADAGPAQQQQTIKQ